MTVVSPSPADVRAIIVGVESYPGLGRRFDLPGAVEGAVAFAKWLVSARGVSQQGIEMWLSDCDGNSPRQICANAGLEEVVAHQFDWSEFQDTIAEPRGAFKTGRYLITYYCGHGVISGPRGEQYLVQPGATSDQFRCFETGNWRELFKAFGWERFRHQLWILDACRIHWGEAMNVIPDEWNPGEASPVSQCVMFACSGGETAGVDSKSGPRFMSELLKTLADTSVVDWPDFEQALKDTADVVRKQSSGSQRPTLIGVDWDGHQMAGSEMPRIELLELLQAIPWPYKNFKPYVACACAFATKHSVLVVPECLEDALELLDDMPSIDGIPPLLDFAERVSRVSQADPLRQWIGRTLTLQQKAELAVRLDTEPARARLSLWYRDDGVTCIEADLDIFVDVGGLGNWQRRPAKPVTPETVGKTLGQWLNEVYIHAGGVSLELLVELYLPRELLTSAAFDIATIPLDDDDKEMLRLGDDHPTMLRCTDRYKGRLNRKRWKTNAPLILGRLVEAGRTPLRWACPTEDATVLKDVFISEEVGAPVWLGYDRNACDGDKPLDDALAEGLPAIVWLRATACDEVLIALQADLQDLLAVSLDQLPDRLARWRRVQQDDAGRTLALLLDDPNQEPALWHDWLQPGS